jgi:hypothetical protein
MVRGLGLAAFVALAAVACKKDQAVVSPSAPTNNVAEVAAPGPGDAAIDGGEAPAAGGESDWGIRGEGASYAKVIDKVSSMVSDPRVQSGAARRGLSLVNVMWEDTGRDEGSALGPNISDLTLQVRRRDERGNFLSALMPVVRFPNFTDRTGDIPANGLHHRSVHRAGLVQ